MKMIVQMFIQIVTFSSFRYIFRSGMAKSFDDLSTTDTENATTKAETVFIL